MLGAPKLKLKPPPEDAPVPFVLDELAPNAGAGEGLGAPKAGAGEALPPAPNAGADEEFPVPKAGVDEAPALGCPNEKPDDGAAAPNPEDDCGALDEPNPVPAWNRNQLSFNAQITVCGEKLTRGRSAKGERSRLSAR